MKKHYPTITCKTLLKGIFGGLTLSLMFLSSAPKANAETSPKRELRSAWYSTAWAIDYPKNGYASTATGVKNMKAEADAYLDKAKAAGHNAVFFQVRPMADRMYLTTSYTTPAGKTYTVYEPVSSSLSGTRGTAPNGNFDALQYWIDGAHARGLELHAWVNPYRIPNTLSTSQDKAVESWTIYWNAGTTAEPNNKRIFNPALEQTNTRIENVCCVLAGAYDIDGIVFDDYFYPENLCSYTGTDAPDYAQYKAYKDGGGTMSAGDWRRDNVNKMVERTYKAIKAIKPWVRFGISPAGVATKGLKTSDGIPALSKYCSASDWQYASIGSDPMAWMRSKTVDYISPQIYWKNTSSTNPFNKISEWYSIVANTFGRHIYASHSVSYMASTQTQADWKEMSEQVTANREKNLDGAPGSVFYSAINTFKGCDTYIKNANFTTPALVPAMTWFKDQATDPGKVADLAKKDDKLSWTEISGMRYVVYAIPMEVMPEDAVTANQGLRKKYLQQVTYTPSFTLSSTVSDASKYWYAVTVLDRFGFEWDYASLGVPGQEEEYTGTPEGVDYDQVELSANSKLNFSSLWIHRPTTDPVTLAEATFSRGMTVRSGAEQPVKDVLYIVVKSEGSSIATTTLSRYDAMTGEELAPLQVTYDKDFNVAYAPGNDIILDDANQLITHSLALASNTMSLAVIDPATGAAKTVVTGKPGVRVDHLDVYGKIADGETYYVFFPSSTGSVVRWTVKDKVITDTKTITLNAGGAARAHAVSPDRVWVNGSGIKAPVLLDFSTGKTVATAVAPVAPEIAQPTALTTFNYEDESYFFYQATYSDGASATTKWSLAKGTDFSTGIDGANLLWTFPKDGLGTVKNAGLDFGAPVAVLQPAAPASAPAVGQEEFVESAPVYLYGYSPGNGMAAYKLVKQVTTGVEEVVADEADENAPVEYFDLEGRRVKPDDNLHGVYIRHQGTKSTKVVL